MAGPTDLHEIAEELLAASVEALDTIPTFSPGLAGAPERNFVSPGRPAFDNCCDHGGQLTVNAALIAPKQTNPTVQGIDPRFARINLVQFNITIVRCIPTASGQWAEPPSSAALALAADQTDADAWALWNHLWNMVRAGTLLTLCSELFFDGLRALDPSGGCGGWVLALRAQVDGYEEILGT